MDLRLAIFRRVDRRDGVGVFHRVTVGRLALEQDVADHGGEYDQHQGSEGQSGDQFIGVHGNDLRLGSEMGMLMATGPGPALFRHVAA